MADGEYTITLRNATSGGEEDSGPIAGGRSSVTQTAAPSDRAAAKNVVKGLVAYNKFLKPFVSQTLRQAVNTVSLRTGSQELQQRISFAYDTASSAASIGESILTGFALGRGAGAVVGAAIGIGTTIVNYANKLKTLDLERSLETISNSLLDQRAGGFIPSYNGSRGSRQ